MRRALGWLMREEMKVDGGAMLGRVVAIALLSLLGCAALPQANVPYVLLKIALLLAAEMGLIGIMLGMFLHSRTYFAGVQLFVASMLMLWLESKHHAYSAVAVAVLSLAFGVFVLVQQRRRVPQLIAVAQSPTQRA